MKVDPTKQKKSTLYSVRTKASELVDFPGVNAPYVKHCNYNDYVNHCDSES